MGPKGKLRTIKIISVVAFNLICLFSIFYVIVMTVDKRQASSAETEVKVIKEFESPKKAAQPQPQAQAPAQAQQASVQQQPAQTIAPVSIPAPQVTATAATQPQPSPKVFLVDDFEGEEVRNKIGAKANVYTRAPSRIMTSRREDTVNGKKGKVLMIRYDKKNSGGPNGMGGWCGYYTLTKDEKAGRYFDGSDYKYITFWVKGEKGDENFMVGLADEHWDRIGDSLKSEEIGVYLEKSKITTQWQKAKIPLDIFFLDRATLSAITINFESDCFPEGAGSGTVFIKDIAIEK